MFVVVSRVKVISPILSRATPTLPYRRCHRWITWYPLHQLPWSSFFFPLHSQYAGLTTRGLFNCERIQNWFSTIKSVRQKRNCSRVIIWILLQFDIEQKYLTYWHIEIQWMARQSKKMVSISSIVWSMKYTSWFSHELRTNNDCVLRRCFLRNPDYA